MAEIRSSILRVVVTPAQQVLAITANTPSTTSLNSTLSHLSHLRSLLLSHFSTLLSSPRNYSPRHYFTLLALFYLLSRFYRWFIRDRTIIHDKLFVITGGGGCIGKEIAFELAKRGARLALWDINQTELTTVQDEVLAKYPRTICLPYLVDVSDREAIYTTARTTFVKQGYVYGIINNAGIVSGKPLLEIEDERILKTLHVNTLSHVWTIKSFLPHMIADRNQGGHLISIVSLAGLIGAPLMTDYCLSKFAVVGFIESLRVELHKFGHRHIHTSIICPGHVRTPLFTGFNSGCLLQSLQPSYVAQKVVEAIEYRDELVLMPRIAHLALGLKSVCPTWLDDAIKRMTGLGNSMDQFKGRTGR